MDINVRIEVHASIFPLGALLLTVILRGTKGNLFYCSYFYWEPFFLATNSEEIWFPLVPGDITVTKKIPAGIFSLRTLFLTVISREN
jgi:hypothetical protein